MQHDIEFMNLLKAKRFDANGDYGFNPYTSCVVERNYKAPTYSVNRGTYVMYTATDTIYTLYPHRPTSIKTGCSFFIPDGYYLFIPARNRSGYDIQCGIYTGRVDNLRVLVRSVADLPFRLHEAEPLCEFLILEISNTEVYCNV